jgi:phosphoribosylpyrophosphate synthetase
MDFNDVRRTLPQEFQERLNKIDFLQLAPDDGAKNTRSNGAGAQEKNSSLILANRIARSRRLRKEYRQQLCALVRRINSRSAAGMDDIISLAQSYPADKKEELTNQLAKIKGESDYFANNREFARRRLRVRAEGASRDRGIWWNRRQS